MSLYWISPSAGQITQLFELDYEEPFVYSVTFECSDDIIEDPELIKIAYRLTSGQFPEYYDFYHTSNTTAVLSIGSLVRELDEYIEGFEKPIPFSYDTEEMAGGNYASYGSDLTNGKLIEFQLTAYDISTYGDTYDSYGDYSGIEDYSIFPNLISRDFSIRVLNNWSSSRDKFVMDYYSEGINNMTAEEYIIYQKSRGYFT